MHARRPDSNSKQRNIVRITPADWGLGFGKGGGGGEREREKERERTSGDPNRENKGKRTSELNARPPSAAAAVSIPGAVAVCLREVSIPTRPSIPPWVSMASRFCSDLCASSLSRPAAIFLAEKLVASEARVAHAFPMSPTEGYGEGQGGRGTVTGQNEGMRLIII